MMVRRSVTYHMDKVAAVVAKQEAEHTTSKARAEVRARPFTRAHTATCLAVCRVCSLPATLTASCAVPCLSAGNHRRLQPPLRAIHNATKNMETAQQRRLPSTPSTHLEDEDEDEKDNFWVKTLGRVTT